MQKYFSHLNPTLPPDAVVLQFTPSDDLAGSENTDSISTRSMGLTFF
jgi:hypothetical protein